jgi:hypothetical protein
VTPNQLADELRISPKTLRAWLRRTYPRNDSEKWSEWELTQEQIKAARERWAQDASETSAIVRTVTRPLRDPITDEGYVINLCDEILRERAFRQHRFTWLLGDPGKRGSRAALPVDAYYPDHELVVEYRERQHDEPVAFFDRRDTVSGFTRGEQRRLYDRRREAEIPRHGLRLVIVKPSNLDSDRRGRLRRNVDNDFTALRALLTSPDDPQGTRGPNRRT